MKRLLTMTAITVAVMLVVLPLTYGQDKAAPAQAADKVFQGQLVKVDPDAKSITVKGNMEMTFEYSDRTQVTGSEKTIQGLAGKTGTDLKVTYREAQGK